MDMYDREPSGIYINVKDVATDITSLIEYHNDLLSTYKHNVSKMEAKLQNLKEASNPIISNYPELFV